MSYNVVCAGEALIDLTSTAYANTLADASAFAPNVGGSPANLAHNLQRLGLRVALIAGVGRDALGGRIVASFRDSGLPTDLLHRSAQPTTLVLVTKSKGNPDFEVYRGADADVPYAPFATALGAGADLFHTTCFALSGLPMRSQLLRAGEAFARTGATLSIDANYAAKVWPDRERAQRTLLQYVRYGALVKMSEVDYERLYERPLIIGDAEAAAAPFLKAGAVRVCFTFGAEGAVSVDGSGVETCTSPAIDVVDATGAGDAFWSGYLAAFLDGRGQAACLRAGSGVAAVKLQQQGPLREQLDWRAL